VSLAIIWIGSTPAFANWLMSRLEAEYPPVAIELLPKADVAIVTGGAVGQPLPPRLAPDLGGAADRVFHAARILRAGKASHILVAAGNLPWLPAAASEAELIRELLVEFGVSDEVIVLETESRNTRENPVNSAAVFHQRGWQSGLLVTSGAHMPRTLAVFHRAGLAVTPAATDIQATYPLYNGPIDLLPEATALATTTAAIKEWLGLIVYRYRGWA
jgi:uncharacterized SAM-binding protein YcdF (DUF218 family)